MSSITGLNALERRAALSLAMIFALRMLGLFMILPVFAIYADELEGVTPTLVGLAIGVYGLTQASLQIPFGMASDRLGRKPVIIGGLLLFAAGSVVAAMSHTIIGVIIGRALQGAGAIASAVMATLADLTREEHRTKAMAIIGATIGFSFLIAMVMGPLLNAWIGVPGIFWLTALMALFGIVIVLFVVPTPEYTTLHRDAEPVPEQFASVLRDGQLLRLDLGIFVLHMVLTGNFVVIPLLLRDAGLISAEHWHIYLPVMLMAMAVMVPFIILAEKKRQIKSVMLGAIMILLISELLLSYLHASVPIIAVLLWLFFTAFNVLEASLPSLVAKYVQPQSKGTAMGVYSSSQFIGAFIGGAAGGALYGTYGAAAVFMFSAILLGIWFLAASSMQAPRYLSTELIKVGPVDADEARDLERVMGTIAGVAEVSVNADDGVAYLKVDKQILDVEAMGRFLIAGKPDK